ncbi:inactive serine protease scarface isoform X2 [Megachile rotundata]|uniref:inactive serine protease scarface isoform X2 n=1 Tax=Megachile rotundata TaxID=143995 RepID=UPI000614C050|nr:PREDICTED: uncharacterized protein LOC100875199 [Megachile rotundata]
MRIYKPYTHSEDAKKMLFGALILVSTILATNGYPSTPPSSDIVHQDSIQQEVVYQTPEEQQFILQSPEEQLVFQSPEEQKYLYQSGQEPFNDDLFGDINSPSGFVEQGVDFTISCVGENKICTSKNDCVNGYVHVANNVAYSVPGKVQQCKVQTEVCCTIAESQGTVVKTETPKQELGSDANNVGTKVPRPLVPSHQGEENRGTGNLQPADDIAVQNAFAAAIPVQVGCAAALLCVEEKFCTMDGTISPEPVTLSGKQLFQRVPLSTCKNPDNGIIGKCCRDPNYVDPWPTGNLPANYSGGFDEQGFPTFLNIAKVKPTKTTKGGTKSPRPQPRPPVEQKIEPTLLPENSVVSSEVLLPPIENVPVDENRKHQFVEQPAQICGVRNKVLQKAEESETAFAEIPWQAMVLHSEERKILCSGALVSAYDVLTAANCVDRLLPNDVSIKLGEWKLGYELKHEEPLPYQIINVSYINIHPGYSKGYGEHDLAILHLQQPATFNYHINPLCMPTIRTPLQQNRQCITTGWGKSILQAHYAGAIMHAVNLDILSQERCKQQISHTDLSVNTVDGTICAKTTKEINNVCETDVGGPLACENESGLYELAGIYSQDTGCLPTNQVAIFAPLDDKWVKETMLKSPSESLTFTNQKESSTEYQESLLVNDYRQSTLSTDNQYLPPN